MLKRLVINKQEKMKIAVYHIGYSSEGESSIFILYGEDKDIYYSMAIDCYEESQCNITDSILKEWGIAEKKLDMLIWTHPHDDHSAGLVQLVKKYCSAEKTKICTANIFGEAERVSDVCRENIFFLGSLLQRKKAMNRINLHPMHCYPDIMDEIAFLGYGKFDRMVLKCIAPMPNIGGIQGINKTFDGNKICLGCVVKLEGIAGEINLMFAGDVDNMTFEELAYDSDSEISAAYNYIKIPHHGSEKGRKLMELLQKSGDTSEYASTSVNLRNHLPNRKVMSEYGKVVETLICTSDIVDYHYGKGVVYLDFDLEKKTIKTQLYGTAAIINKDKLKNNAA